MRNNSTKYFQYTTVFIALTLPSITNAEDSLKLGLLTGGETTIYKGVDEEISAFPLISARYGMFFFQGLQGGVSFFEDKDYNLDLFVTYSGQGYDASDSSVFYGMEDRDGAVEAGFSTSYRIGFGEIDFGFAHDVSGIYEGFHTQLNCNIPLMRGERFMLRSSFGVEWLSEDMVAYYYGVKSSEATSDRSAYSPGSTINANVSLMSIVSLSENWALRMRVEYELLGEEISESPLVEKDYRASAGIGVIYSF